MNARDALIYHFTHVDNLPSIAGGGRLVCDASAQQGALKAEVGDLEIKAARRQRQLPVGPGGCVGDYVPFYFAPRSPMMFRIACDHRDSVDRPYRGGDRPSSSWSRPLERSSTRVCGG